MKQRLGVSILALFFFSGISRAQAPTAVVNGQVRDSSGAAIAGAAVEVFNDATHVRYSTETNDEGIYSLPNLPPGAYHIQVSKQGFKTVVHPDITLNVQDAKAIGFTLPIGPISDTVTVEGGASLIDTESAAVSTVVDRQFAENLPMNGRSFQTLIQLTPGVVVTPTTNTDNGQFSVNGQRAASNYWMVDGVSANVGIGNNQFSVGNGLSGASAGLSVLGGTNSLVSVDALQEFRIQTSTYAPEFGRTPGGQISIVTRSGTNHFHGTAFNYLRNDIFDAKNWFNGFVTPPLPKSKERQNDFGGTFSGPVLKDKTFFFFSYEGLRLRLPQTALSLVPDLQARQNAIPAMQPFLNAFPLPNGVDNTTTNVAQFNASYSNAASLDAYSLRLDHRLNNKLTFFGRYNYSPSSLSQRGTSSLNAVTPSQTILQTGTVGATWAVSPLTVNDGRFNYSRTDSKSFGFMDGFGGATPLTSFPFPSGFDSSNANFFPAWLSLGAYPGPNLGFDGHNLQRQINIVDNLTTQKGAHSLKFGIDFRRLSPDFGDAAYTQQVLFLDVPSSTSGKIFFANVASGRGGTFLFHNLGAFAQDTWRIVPRLTLTYGLRWDVDFAPSSNPSFVAVAGFDLNNLSNLALAPAGTPPFQTTYGNVAPRIGVAYQIRRSQNWETVLRGGFGVFYDMATSEAGNLINFQQYPFGATKFVYGPPFGGTSTFPLSSSDAAPPSITLGTKLGTAYALDPHLKLPYTLEWDFTVEQALGPQQSLSASYVGAGGRRLIQTLSARTPGSSSITGTQLVTNAATSDYEALQVQFRRRLSRGLQALAFYTWSHSVDTASAGSVGVSGNTLPAGAINQNRGPSDFDIRQAFSAGVTYDVPAPNLNAFAKAILRGWSLENVVQARSAVPVTASVGQGTILNNVRTLIRPNVVAGQPLYLYGAQCAQLLGSVSQGGNGELQAGQSCPGGKALSPNAFVAPAPGQQGNLGRNALRGFGATQWDLAVHRDFPFRESLKLQFRAEMFNVLNHPNFGPPISDIRNKTQFGLSTQTLGNSLAGGYVGGGAFNPLYQLGGPRSMQFALKFMF